MRARGPQLVQPGPDPHRAVIEPGALRRWGRSVGPHLHDRDVVMIVAGREERHRPSELPTGNFLEPEDVAIEPRRALDVTHLEDHMADVLDPDRHRAQMIP